MTLKRNRANRTGLALGLLAVALLLAACGAPLDGKDAVRAATSASPTAHSPREEKATEPADWVAAQPSPTATTAIQGQATKAVKPAPAPSATPVDAPTTRGAGRAPAPDFRLPGLQGEAWTLTQFRDQPVMLFYWATW